MSQPDFNKTLTSLYSAMTEIKHLRTELEAKKAIIAQLNSKIAVLESSKGSACAGCAECPTGTCVYWQLV